MNKISDLKATMQSYGIRAIMENREGESSRPQLRRTYSTVVPESDMFVGLEDKIVVHCGGLPLAVIVLGGILAGKSSYNEWETVHKNVKSYLGKGKSIGQDEGDIILALSYYDLPYQLKPCFLYLSRYTEGEEIKVDTLYQIWMAEGMISNKDRIGDDETMMDIAERYLEELAERCMVFVEMKKEPRIRRIKSCRLHDLMRDMCIFKAKEENFLDLVDYGQASIPGLLSLHPLIFELFRQAFLNLRSSMDAWSTSPVFNS